MKRFEEQDSASLKKQKLDEMSQNTNTTNTTNTTTQTSPKAEEKKEDFFKPVGEAAAEVDNDEDMNTTVHATGAEDAYGHPVQEVESLYKLLNQNGVSVNLLNWIWKFQLQRDN
ncbi:unnamed protein product [[Candida] boidinii]|nr:unnamed protein product [[Candida] boidinii]